MDATRPIKAFGLTFAFLLGAAAALGAIDSQAAMLRNLSGNHRAVAESLPGLDASLSFAVYRLGNLPGDRFGTGMTGFDNSFSAAPGFPSQLDTSAEYLYLYQYVNDGPGTSQFNSLYIPAIGVTSLGSWNWGFQDSDGPVDFGNPFGFNRGNHVPAAAPNLGVIAGSVANTLTVVDKVPALQLDGGWVVGTFNLFHGEATTVFGFTSDAPPVIQHVTTDSCLDNFSCGSYVRPLNADFNRDGVIDEQDLEKWLADYGSEDSDADGDTDSDGTDFLHWQRQRQSPVFGATTIPEPSTTVLASTLCAAALIGRRHTFG